MRILAIETSCDDTGIAIIEYNKTGRPKILADFVSSQIKVHAPWGGIVPMLAKREHQKNLVPLFIKALKKAKLFNPLRHPEGVPLSGTTEGSIDSSPRRGGAQNDKRKIKGIKPQGPVAAEGSKGITQPQQSCWVFSNPVFCLRSDDMPAGASSSLAKIKILNKILEREPGLFKKLIPFLQKYQKPNIDYIAVTVGPGLEPALWAGINFARAMSYWWNIPLLPTNHIEGHLTAAFANSESCGIFNFLQSYQDSSTKSGQYPIFKKILPAVALVVSGGHTQLILIKKFGYYRIIGETRDDAAGEAFDKVAKMLNLGYPGGPAIAKLTSQWNDQLPITNDQKNSKLQNTNYKILLPRPMMNSGDFDFSFSGLKTAVLYLLQKMPTAQIKKSTPAIAAEFQQAVIDVLAAKTISAAKKYNAKTIILAGGVATNDLLRNTLSLNTQHLSLNFLVPPKNLCTDNAAMIALTAYWQLAQKRAKKTGWRTLKANANLRIS